MEDITKRKPSSTEGTNVKDTNMLKGESRPAAARKDSNEMKPYVCGAPEKGKLGGEAAH